nr:MAG TPA: hypothetical protein [Caudoviricetes sp.]
MFHISLFKKLNLLNCLINKTVRSIRDIRELFSYNAVHAPLFPFLSQSLRPVLSRTCTHRNEQYQMDTLQDKDNSYNAHYICFSRSYFFWFIYVQVSTYKIVNTSTMSAIISFPVSGSPSASEQVKKMPINAIGLCFSVNIVINFSASKLGLLCIE